LRPSALDDLGLLAALQKHCATFAQRFGVSVDCQAVGLNGVARLPVKIETALYRIVQESLTNAVRHGQAQSIQVLVQRKESAVLTVIEDDGCGFEARDWRVRCLADDHLGLLGIEERAALFGGTLRVESRPGSGTSLFVEIPVQS
jgi:two-component system sensor histidine kinase UhpB